MIEVGLTLTSLGMSSVFIVLSILAIVMWLLGKIFGENKSNKNSYSVPKPKSSNSRFSELELLAISTAVVQYESVRLPKVNTPENWKRYAKIYASRWSE